MIIYVLILFNIRNIGIDFIKIIKLYWFYVVWRFIGGYFLDVSRNVLGSYCFV